MVESASLGGKDSCPDPSISWAASVLPSVIRENDTCLQVASGGWSGGSEGFVNHNRLRPVRQTSSDPSLPTPDLQKQQTGSLAQGPEQSPGLV